MTSQQLITFITVARELNFRKAAEQLFVTQPAVSKHINALEEELGFQLFIRSRRSVILTPQGERFYQFAIQTRDEYEKTMHEISRLKDTQVLNICSEIGFHSTPVSDTIAIFMKDYPLVSIKMEFCENKEFNSAIKNRYYDLYITHQERLWTFTEEYDLNKMVIEDKRFGIYAKKGYMNVNRQPKNLKVYDGCDFLDPFSDDQIGKHNGAPEIPLEIRDQMIRSLGLNPARIVPTPNWHTLMAMLDLGVGVTLLPENDSFKKDTEHFWIPTEKTDPIVALWYKESSNQYQKVFINLLNKNIEQKDEK